MNEMSFNVELSIPFDQAIERVTEALKTEEFGVLTRIDLHNAFKEKLGETFRPYVILGACNPKLAHKAVSIRPEVGLFLPCNVMVEQLGENRIKVSILNPDSMMQAAGLDSDSTLKEVGAEAGERLKRVAQALRD